MEEYRRIAERMERSNQHVLRTLATQREIVEKALQQVQIAMLQQEVALQSHMLCCTESWTGLDTILEDHERRLRRLEDGGTPAA
ncbi:MAG: hypothetical protein AB1758_27715 [Candidatus Eremiobacterota bacterium]